MVEIKCPEPVCESVPSKENLNYLIKDVEKQKLYKLKKNHNYFAQIQSQIAISNWKQILGLLFTRLIAII